MAANQKQVAISEFFEKNKHFLGFDTLNRGLITAVKEAVDNALDACEEARILPDIIVKITKLDNKKDILQLEVEDNGPGYSQSKHREGVWTVVVRITISCHSTIERAAGNRNYRCCDVFSTHDR